MSRPSNLEMESGIQIKLNRAGIGVVSIDGNDVSKYVRSVAFFAEAGAITKCVLSLVADVEIEADVRLTLNKFFEPEED